MAATGGTGCLGIQAPCRRSSVPNAKGDRVAPGRVLSRPSSLTGATGLAGKFAVTGLNAMRVTPFESAHEPDLPVPPLTRSCGTTTKTRLVVPTSCRSLICIATLCFLSSRSG